MPRLLRALCVFLASATDRELARMVEYPKEVNRILRSKLPERITVTPRERARLVKLGRAVGSAIRELVTIVSPRTFARWVAGAKNASGKAGRGTNSEAGVTSNRV
jgi:putative transposase